jgi:hypothetical protein
MGMMWLFGHVSLPAPVDSCRANHLGIRAGRQPLWGIGRQVGMNLSRPIRRH